MADWEVPRREPRFRLQIPVQLRLGKQIIDLVTEDVSFSGMFLRTDQPPPQRGLVKVDVPVDGELQPIPLVAMVVHSISPSPDSRRIPGAGLQLYGVGGEVRDRWARFILSLRQRHQDAASRPVRVEVSSVTPPVEPINRRHVRFAAVLAVRSKTLDELVTTYTRDISQGGTFLTTDVPLIAGDDLYLELIHPESGNAFGLQCIVKRKVRDGVGVEFSDLDEQRRELFWRFVEPVIELDDGDLVLLD
ncbi:MAG TPA: PilZ domain-containing protein [Kofleriaceae bacterium]|nr:PilZ domain-containing protein [Kofleriaceae bacterium]